MRKISTTRFSSTFAPRITHDRTGRLTGGLYGTSTVNSPGEVIWITPAQAHINLQLLSSVGVSAISTLGTPGTQGAGITGMHGIGVSAPSAAAVAAATAGFADDMHIPNGMMFASGLLSRMLAAGVPVNTRFCGSTTKDDGAIPKLHWSTAPKQTCIAIQAILLARRTSFTLPDRKECAKSRKRVRVTQWFGA